MSPVAKSMKKPPLSIDGFIAKRIRERRLMLGLTQQQFGDMIGVSSQQAVKYEYGINSISAGRLYEIACVLNVPVDFFFEDFGENNAAQSRGHQRMLLNMVRNFEGIQDEKHREAIKELTRTLAGR
jgi:transcriptional regulator with XRE-family HTH domain